MLLTPSPCLPLQGMLSNPFGHLSRAAAQAHLKSLPASLNLHPAVCSALLSFFVYLPIQGSGGWPDLGSLKAAGLGLAATSHAAFSPVQGGLPTAASEAHVLFQTGGLYQTGRRRSSDVQSTPGTVGGGTMRTSYGATQAMTRHAALPPTPDFTDLVHNRRAALGQETDPVRQ